MPSIEGEILTRFLDGLQQATALDPDTLKDLEALLRSPEFQKANQPELEQLFRESKLGPAE